MGEGAGSADDIDFADAESWNAGMPERLQRQRAEAPVFWSEKTGAFVLTRFDDVVHVSKHSELFCLALDVAAGVSPPVFIAHGRSDPIVGFDAAGRMRRVLEANGFPVTLHAHPGDHGIDPCTVRELRAFLLEDGG